MQEEPGQEQAEEGGGLPVELLRSYLAFASRAIKQRKILIGVVATIGLILTVLVAKYIPRTFTCTTVMTAVSSGVLDPERGPSALAGAESQIMSHDNLESLIRDTNLKKTYFARRPPLLALKDRLIVSLFGPMDDKTLTAVLVGTIETKLSAKVEKDELTITVDWSDAQTSAELAEAAKESFLRVRHGAEISAFQEKMAILDSHAGKLRDEIEVLAAQLKQRLEEKKAERLAEVTAERKKRKDELGKEAAAAAAEAPARVVISRRATSDEQLPELRQRLNSMKQELANAESQRNSRIRDEQAKLSDLQLKFTPNHPQVITQAERVAVASQVPGELAVLRAEVSDMESQIRQREAMTKSGSTSVSLIPGDTAGATPRTSEPLPSEIVGLLDERDADPALAAQMSGAVVRYGSLRDDVRGAKIALDTAQAAFNHRYRMVIPVQTPTRPSKPKVAVLLGAGLALSLLIAFLLPILLELRRDYVTATWQVQQLELPVLAQLHLPKRSEE